MTFIVWTSILLYKDVSRPCNLFQVLTNIYVALLCFSPYKLADCVDIISFLFDYCDTPFSFLGQKAQLRYAKYLIQCMANWLCQLYWKNNSRKNFQFALNKTFDIGSSDYLLPTGDKFKKRGLKNCTVKQCYLNSCLYHIHGICDLCKLKQLW